MSIRRVSVANSNNNHISQELVHSASRSEKELGRKLSNADAVTAIVLDSKEADITFPDGGYGWVCVACIFLVNANTWGSYSVFLAYFLSHDTYPSTSSIVYALIGGLSISQALLISPLTVYTNYRFGIRTTMLIGTLLQTTALVAASFSTQIWHLILSQGLLFGYGMGFLYVGSAGLISQWFLLKRSLTQGIVSAGVGIGGFVYTLVTGFLLTRIGLSWTFRVQAFASLACNLLATLLVRDRDAAVKPTHQSFSPRLFARFDFLMLLGWGFITEFGYITLYYSLPDYGASVGLTAKQGSIVASLLSLGTAIGRPILGHVSDRFGRINIAISATMYNGVLCLLLWVFAPGFAALAIFAALVGLACGNFWATCAPVTAEVVGVKALPDTLATLWLVLSVPTIVAEPIALQLRRSHGNIYLPTQLFAGFAYLGGGFCLWLLRPRRIHQMNTERRNRRQPTELTTLQPMEEEATPEHRRQAWRWIAAMVAPRRV